MMESGRQNGEGNRSEVERLVRAWGFNIRRIEAPVFLFHGDQDKMMHVGPARLMARVLKGCAPTYYAGEGHFSVLVNKADELLDVLAARSRLSPPVTPRS
jgi:pimeloyl-ACP methyl ester carboxylesterase